MSNQVAIQPYNRFKDLLKSENVQERFNQLLAKRAPEFLASLLTLVTADRNLIECEPATILAAAAKAAILRLPIAKELGFAYIVPFKREATFVIGYKGLIQLAIRTGQYVTINAAEIYQGEELTVDRLTGMVEISGKRTGDEVTAYVSYFKLKNGFEKYLTMDRGVVQRHAERYSKSWGNQRSAWSTNFDDMAKKTVLRQLLGKYGLLSIEMLDQDTEAIPLAGSDPRLTMPKFDDIPDVLDGVARDPDPEPEPQPEPPDAETQTVQWIVEQHYAENEHAARNILKKVKPEHLESQEKLTAWFRAYRGWRDMDAKSDKAAEYANNGEMPH